MEFQSSKEQLKKKKSVFLSWYSLCCIKFARDSVSASHDDETIFSKQINGYQLETVSNAHYSGFPKSDAF